MVLVLVFKMPQNLSLVYCISYVVFKCTLNWMIHFIKQRFCTPLYKNSWVVGKKQVRKWARNALKNLLCNALFISWPNTNFASTVLSEQGVKGAMPPPFCQTGRNCFNLFQISFSANTADTHPQRCQGCQKTANFVINH